MESLKKALQYKTRELDFYSQSTKWGSLGLESFKKPLQYETRELDFYSQSTKWGSLGLESFSLGLQKSGVGVIEETIAVRNEGT